MHAVPVWGLLVRESEREEKERERGVGGRYAGAFHGPGLCCQSDAVYRDQA